MAGGATVHKLGKRPLHNPEEGPNSELELTWSGDELIYIDKTIGEIKYRKTLTWVGGNLVAISEWVEQ